MSLSTPLIAGIIHERAWLAPLQCSSEVTLASDQDALSVVLRMVLRTRGLVELLPLRVAAGSEATVVDYLAVVVDQLKAQYRTAIGAELLAPFPPPPDSMFALMSDRDAELSRLRVTVARYEAALGITHEPPTPTPE